MNKRSIILAGLSMLICLISHAENKQDTTTINDTADYSLTGFSKKHSCFFIDRQMMQRLPFRDFKNLSLMFPNVYYREGNTFYFNGIQATGKYIYLDGLPLSDVDALPFSSAVTFGLYTLYAPVYMGNSLSGFMLIEPPKPQEKVSVSFGVNTAAPYNYKIQNWELGIELWGLKKITKSLPPLSYHDKKNIEIFINGPLPFYIINKKVKPTFIFTANIIQVTDPNPSIVSSISVNDEVRQYLTSNPLRPTELGFGSYKTADFIKSDNFVNSRYKQNAGRFDNSIFFKLIIPISEQIELTLGNYSQLSLGKYYIYENAMFNSENNPDVTKININHYARLTHRIFSSGEFKWNYQFQYSHSVKNFKMEDHTFKDNLFNYGYVGKFTTNKIKTYSQNLEYDPVTGLLGHLQNGFIDTLYQFEYSPVNDAASKYTEFYYNMYSVTEGFYQNKEQVQSGGGLLNGQSIPDVYSLWNNVGNINDYYGKSQQEEYRFAVLSNMDYKMHHFLFGFEYVKRTERNYSVRPVGLWTLARQLTNNHIIELDESNPHPVYDEQGIFQDTIWYDRLYSKQNQAFFDINLRKKLGLPVEGTEWIDLDSYDPSLFSLDMFSPDELLNKGNSYVNYYGYDYFGNKIKSKPSFRDFFTQKNSDGYYIRTTAAFQPIYAAAYGQYTISYKWIDFAAGLRIDRYDANQPVLKDKYSLYEIKTAGEVTEINGDPVSHPSGIGDDYKVYVDNFKHPSAILGYRNGDTWYNNKGQEINDPTIISAATGVIPYLKYPGVSMGEGYDPEQTFKMYEPVIHFLPNFSLDIKIDENSFFYSKFSSFTQTPQYYSIFQPLQYYFITSYHGYIINNPDLKPERIHKFHTGFKHKMFSFLEFDASYFRNTLYDYIGIKYIAGAYPINYFTCENMDTIRTEGLTLSLVCNNPLKSGFNAGINFSYFFGNIWSDFSYPSQPENLLNSFVGYYFSEGNNYKGWITKKGKKPLEYLGASIFMHYRKGIHFLKSTTIYPSGFINNQYTYFISSEKGKLPDFYYFDMMIEKGFSFFSNRYFIRTYILFQNLLNFKNIHSVYPATGSPDDDGYLNAPEYQDQIQSHNDPQAFRDLYSAKINNPFHYDIPRIIRLGVSFTF